MRASTGQSLAPYVVPLFAALIGNCLYHLSSRGAAQKAPPFATLTAVYLVATALSLVMALSVERATLRTVTNILFAPTALLLAAAVVMIEVGFLFAYRANAPIASSSLLVNASVAVILALIGIAVFREGVSGRVLAGMAVTLIGVIVIATAPASTTQTASASAATPAR
jgi:drug/metabolite transporter (DMT)-like permease